jgi:hypothetical protein
MVATIPPNNRIYALGQVTRAVHVYGQNGNSTYSLTLIGVNAWVNVPINQGQTQSYQPNAAGSALYVQNSGPGTIQVLY